jgi:hypothetical protein
LREGAGEGELLVRVDVEANGRYIEPRKHSAFGALAFIEPPEISGTSAELRLTAVPQQWIDSRKKVIAVLEQAGLPAQIRNRTIELKNDDLSPSQLFRMAGVALFALDSFTRKRVSAKEFDAVRKAALRVFDDGNDILSLLGEDGGKLLRQFFGFGPRLGNRPGSGAGQRPMNDGLEREIATKLGPTIRLEAEPWREAGETLSKWTVDPLWLIYMPSELCSIQSKEVDGPLEHPKAAFDYYSAEGIKKVVVEYKHMGSRAVVIVCRDDDVALRRFGMPGIGCVYTRSGRAFWDDATPALVAIQEGLTRARFWERFETDWVCLDGELLPWALKAENLIEDRHGELLQCGEAALQELSEAFGRLAPSELSKLNERKECYRRYRVLYERYQLEADEPFRFAPFHLIATEGRAYFDHNHNWHMEVLRSLVHRAEDPFCETEYQTFSLDDEAAVEKCCGWWEELSESGAEGLVVKPFYFAPRGRRGSAQPGIKCRGREHLRMVYGPEYDLLENRWDLAGRDALARRREKHRRVLKQFALSMEGVERFVRGEQADRVESCARGVLALER